MANTNVDTDVLICGAGPVAPIANIVELRFTHRPGVTLVRPDGYIAFAADGRDMNSAMQSVRSLLQGQTSSISLDADS